jgi:hypothetical protein
LFWSSLARTLSCGDDICYGTAARCRELEELKTELVSLRVQKIAGGNASKLARM